MERFYYADAVYGRQVALLAGPFATEGEARAILPKARRLATDLDPRASFASFGTCSFETDQGKGKLNRNLWI